jgi:hypothetical protein
MTASAFLAQLAENLEDAPLPECDRLPLARLCRDYATIAIDGPEKPQVTRVLYRWYGTRGDKKPVVATPSPTATKSP